MQDQGGPGGGGQAGARWRKVPSIGVAWVVPVFITEHSIHSLIHSSPHSADVHLPLTIPDQSLAWEDPLEEGMATIPLLLTEKSHGQRSLVGYSPWGRKGIRHDLATKQ